MRRSRIADAKAGEAVKLVSCAASRRTEADVRAYCEANLTGYNGRRSSSSARTAEDRLARY